jgi:hypothetical protein
MWTLPYSAPQKAGVILYGLLIGVLMVPITVLGCVLLGVVVILFTGPNRDAGGAFFLAASAIYGCFLGIPVGLFVCWRVCRSRLREMKPDEAC